MSEPLNVLLLEDMEDDAFLVVQELELGGFQLNWERLETSEALQAALQRQVWDVVISDYRMPQLSAPAALKIIQHSQIDLPFIVVSGMIGEAAAIAMMKAGAHDYVMKDNLQRLSEVVRREVRDARIRAAQKRAQAELARTKERLQLAIEASGLGLWDWYMQSGDLIINGQWADILGYEVHELAPMSFEAWQRYIHPEDLAIAIAAQENHFHHPTETYDCEIRMAHKLGHWVWILARGKVVDWDATGNPLRMAGTVQDITVRRQTELERERAETALQNLVEGTAAVTGGNFFSELVRHITHALGVRHALVTQVVKEGFEVLAACLDGHLRTNTLVPSSTLPCCHQALQTGLCCWSDQLQIIYPNHHWFKTLEAQSCLGVNLQNAEGVPIGNLCILDDRPLTQPEWAHTVLRIFAARAAAELERLQTAQRLEELNAELELRVEQRTAELKEQEDALRESQKFLQTALDILPLCVFWKDVQSVYLGCNQTFAHKAGLQSSLDIVGKTDHDMPWADESAAAYRADDRQVMQTNQAMLGIIETLIPADGQQLWIETNKLPLHDLNGQVIGVLGTYQDISDRKQYELQLQQTNLELARATRLKDEFLATMSHELRTPLNAILGMAEGMQDNIFGPLNERQQRAITTIEQSGQHLLELINDILDLSKIEAGKLELAITEVPIKALCRTSLSFVQPLAHKKQIRLSSQIPASLAHMHIQVDDRRIQQALINLLNNAVKFTPEHGQVILTVGLEPSRAAPLRHLNQPTPDAVLASGQVLVDICFSVIDTGIGIAPQHLNQLFQAFVQIDSSLNRQYEGTGLGLALVKQIVELHGGTVDVVSEVNRGSCFTIRLPYTGAAEPSAQFPIDTANTQPWHNQLAPFTLSYEEPTSLPLPPLILVTADNEASLQTMTAYLASRGYRLAAAATGQSALTWLETHRPDIILLDLQKPGMDGYEVIQRLRENPDYRQIPIIALTALALANDRENHLQAGVNRYISKPVKLRDVVDTIQALLSPQQPDG